HRHRIDHHGRPRGPGPRGHHREADAARSRPPLPDRRRDGRSRAHDGPRSGVSDTTDPETGAQADQTIRRRSATPPDQRPVSDALLKRITRYSGTLSTEAVRALEVELPFFGELSADQRAEIQLIIDRK